MSVKLKYAFTIREEYRCRFQIPVSIRGDHRCSGSQMPIPIREEHRCWVDFRCLCPLEEITGAEWITDACAPQRKIKVQSRFQVPVPIRGDYRVEQIFVPIYPTVLVMPVPKLTGLCDTGIRVNWCLAEQISNTRTKHGRSRMPLPCNGFRVWYPTK